MTSPPCIWRAKLLNTYMRTYAYAHTIHNIYAHIYVHRGYTYIEDIHRWCKDMNFIFEWWKQYFMNEDSEWVKYCFHHSKIKFTSSSHRIIFFLLYRIMLALHLQGPCKGGYPSPPSEFQCLVCRYFGRFLCHCRNFNMTSLRLCWPSLEENFTRLQSYQSYIRQGLRSMFLSEGDWADRLWAFSSQGGPGACSPEKILKFEFLNGWNSVRSL